MVGFFFLQKVIPKLPFEPVGFYCRRTTEIPFMITGEAFNKCMREYSAPSTKVMNYVKQKYGSELNKKQQICFGEAIERYLNGTELDKFLKGTPAINLIGYDKSIDLASDMLKCSKSTK